VNANRVPSPGVDETRIADPWEEEIVRLRKELTELGVDAGAATGSPARR